MTRRDTDGFAQGDANLVKCGRHVQVASDFGLV